MANFTPLKFEKGKIKSQKNLNIFNKKFFLIGNLFLLILIAVVGGVYYYRSKMITTKQKAATRYAFGCKDNDGEVKEGLVNSYLVRDGNCAYVKSDKRSSFEFGQYFFCKANGGPGCPRPGVPADEQDFFTPPTYEKCFKKDCGTEQIDFKFKDSSSGGEGIQCFFSRIDDDCSDSPPVEPTNTPVLTNTPTPTTIITDTPTPTNTPIPTNTPEPTNTSTPTPTTPPNQPTNTPGPTATLVPVPCGTKDCDNATNPCRSGYICVQARDGSNYCASPDFAEACKANPSFQSCCTAPGAPTATPTEIIVAKVTSTPPQQIAQTGDIRSSWVFAVPIGIILLGLLL